ncbi:unnamed protein product, partial [Rotaria magnacalcarata]
MADIEIPSQPMNLGFILTVRMEIA